MNRLIYDSCATKQAMQQSAAPVSWVLDPVRFQHCSECRPELGIVGGTAVSHINGNLVDLENNLFGIDRPGTRCAALKYNPSEPVQGKRDYKTNCYPLVDTRLTHTLPTCKFATYPTVPKEPKMPTFSCP